MIAILVWFHPNRVVPLIVNSAVQDTLVPTPASPYIIRGELFVQGRDMPRGGRTMTHISKATDEKGALDISPGLPAPFDLRLKI